MEYKGQALQCSTLGNDITELILDLQDGSVNKFDRNSLHELNEVVKHLEKDQSVSTSLEKASVRLVGTSSPTMILILTLLPTFHMIS